MVQMLPVVDEYEIERYLVRKDVVSEDYDIAVDFWDADYFNNSYREIDLSLPTESWSEEKQPVIAEIKKLVGNHKRVLVHIYW